MVPGDNVDGGRIHVRGAVPGGPPGTLHIPRRVDRDGDVGAVPRHPLGIGERQVRHRAGHRGDRGRVTRRVHEPGIRPDAVLHGPGVRHGIRADDMVGEDDVQGRGEGRPRKGRTRGGGPAVRPDGRPHRAIRPAGAGMFDPRRVHAEGVRDREDRPVRMPSPPGAYVRVRVPTVTGASTPPWT